jgi:DNA-binding transcriptional MerR regulator
VQFDKKQLTKLYYTIGEVAAMFNVNSSLIRFWEKEFGLIHPKKNKKGNRLYTADNIELFNKIYQLVKTNGYTLEGAKKVLKDKTNPIERSSNESNSTEGTVLRKLEEIKRKLLALKKNN